MDKLQSLARIYFTAAPHVQVRGAGIVRARDIREEGLTLRVVEPPPRHADVEGWDRSATAPKLAKAQNIEKAKVLASKAQLVRW